MNNKKYWEKRKAQQMFEYMEDAEQAAREFTKLYLTASGEIQKAAKKIFRKYQSRYGLSRKEAEQLLSKVRPLEDIRRIIELLKEDPKNKELVKELESQAYGARIGHLNGLYNQLETIALSIYAAQQKRFYAVLTKLAKKAYYNSIFDIQQYSGYGFDFKLLDQKNIEKVLNSRWSGSNYSQTLWKNTDKLARAVKKEIMLNLLMGKPVKDMSESIDQRFGAGYNEARRLIRTESSFVCNQMQLLSYDNCGIEKYIYVAVLDLRTSPVCRSLDKKDFPVVDATPGENYPPMHPWCRSTTIAYMSKELLHKLKQSAIDLATGQRILVPGDMTYQQWYDKYIKGKETAGRNDKESIEKAEGNGIISKSNKDNSAEKIMELRSLGKIGAVDKIEKEFGKLYTEDIIVTNERIKHVRERHLNDYALFEKYGKKATNDPDIVIKDGKNAGTVFMVKKLSDTNLNVVVKVAVDVKHPDYKNSVITFYRLRDRNLEKMVKKEGNKILYKKE